MAEYVVELNRLLHVVPLVGSISSLFSLIKTRNWDELGKKATEKNET